MTIWNIFSLLGGLTIFLFGMTEMNKHLAAITGARMKGIMLTLTKKRFRGYLTGLGITMVNQSSSATTVLEAALVGAGLMTFQQSLAVTLGAELGSTFLPQLVAFPSITKFSSLIIAVGFFMMMLTGTTRGKHIGMTILTFGLLFFGMDMMSSSLKPLRTFEPFINMMKSIETPVWGILIGLVFTMIIQSSGATTGITIAMAMAGTISLEQAVPINLGAAVGTCITAVLGSLALNWEAKRSAYIHVLFQFIGMVWVLVLLMIPFRGERLYIWFIKWFTLNVFGTGSVARQIAMAFTFMPVINHIIVFPNLALVVKIFNKVFPERKGPKPFGPKFIKDSLIRQSISLSLEMTKNEIIRVTEIVQAMISEMREAFRSNNTQILDKIHGDDSRIDLLHKAIITFLARLSQEELSEKESHLCMNYMYIQDELESIGDVINKNISSLARKKIEQNLKFSEDGFHELEHLIYKLDRSFETLKKVIIDDDPETARNLLKLGSSNEEEKYKNLHISRLYQGQQESIATSSVHLDLITYFTRINGHIAYIAEKFIFVNEKKKNKKKKKNKQKKAEIEKPGKILSTGKV